ncbi:hypothetical protein D3C81_1709880 [compost metagenome]
MIVHCTQYITRITDDKALHAPFAFDDVIDLGIHIAWNTIDSIVSRHHGSGSAFPKSRLERFQIILALVAGINADRRAPTIHLIVVGIEVFQCRHGFEIEGIFTLHPLNQPGCKTACKIRIFPIGLLRSPPARIAFHIHRGRPDG